MNKILFKIKKILYIFLFIYKNKELVVTTIM